MPIVLLALIPLYLFAARAHTGKLNNDLHKNDQKVYLRLAKDIHKHGFEYFTSRQRTPGFSYLLAPFWEKQLASGKKSTISVAWFERAKSVNIGLSVFLLGGLWFFFRKTTGVVEALLLTSAIGFLLYVFRAGYVQPELLYWTLKVVAFYLLLRMLVSPGWWLAVAAGALTAAAFFVKAGTLPLMMLFIACFGVKVLWDRVHHKKAINWKLLAQGALVPVVALLILSPYLYNSYRVFGSPFYSAYSKHIMWVDGDYKDEMYAVMWAGSATRLITEGEFQAELAKIKRDKGETYTETRLPTLSRYLDDHSLGEVLSRPLLGLDPNHRRMKRYYRSAYDLLRVCLVIAILVAGWRWLVAAPVDFLLGWLAKRRFGARIARAVQLDPVLREGPLSVARRHLPAALYIAGFFIGYLLLYGWYDDLKIGVRLMLSLYVPTLFVLFLFIQKFAAELTITVKGRTVYVRKMINLFLLLLIVLKIHTVLSGELYQNYSGA